MRISDWSSDVCSSDLATQRNYRRILERFAEKCRDLPVAALKRSHIKTMIGQMEDRPQAANSLLKRLKTLLNFAADIDMIQHKPLLGMRGLDRKSTRLNSSH